MGFTQRELDDALCGAVVELAKASGIHIDPAVSPNLAAVSRFVAEVEAGRRAEREADHEKGSEFERRVQAETAAYKAMHERDLENLVAAHAANPTLYSDWALQQAGVMPSHIPGHAQVIVVP